MGHGFGLLDRAASLLGLSPFELRRRNVVAPEEFPFETPQGLVLHEGSYRESLDALEAAFGYEAFIDRQRDARNESRYLGLGISLFNEVTGMGTSVCYHLGWPVTTHDTSTVRVEPSGRVTVTTSVVSQGQGHETTMAQVAADALGVEVEDVTVRAGDTSQVWGNGTWGSRAAVIGAGSIVRAAEPIREKLARAAASRLEAAPEDIVLERGSAHVAGMPNRSVSVGELAGAFYFGSAHRPAGIDPALEATAAFDPSSIALSNGAHAALVEVDAETGTVHLERFYAVEDCGKMINPMLVEGQIRDCVAQAIGLVLMEEIVYDEQGQLLKTTFMDYLIPGAAEVRRSSWFILRPRPRSRRGIKGMGESAMIAAPAAIVNAVNDAVSPFGVLFEEVPITPPRVLAALARAESRTCRG